MITAWRISAASMWGRCTGGSSAGLVHDTGSAEKRLLQAPVSAIRDENGPVLHLPADLGHSLHPEKTGRLYALGARELYRGETATRGREALTVSARPGGMPRERIRVNAVR